MPEYDFDDCRERLRRATEMIQEAERKAKAAGDEAADAEGIYRFELAAKFKTYRADGKGVEESNTLARGDVVLLSKERDAAAYAWRLALEKLENARDSRRSLWRMIEWARARDVAQAREPENVPRDRWP